MGQQRSVEFRSIVSTSPSWQSGGVCGHEEAHTTEKEKKHIYYFVTLFVFVCVHACV